MKSKKEQPVSKKEDNRKFTNSVDLPIRRRRELLRHFFSVTLPKQKSAWLEAAWGRNDELDDVLLQLDTLPELRWIIIDLVTNTIILEGEPEPFRDLDEQMVLAFLVLNQWALERRQNQRPLAP